MEIQQTGTGSVGPDLNPGNKIITRPGGSRSGIIYRQYREDQKKKTNEHNVIIVGSVLYTY
jgi:inorganic pyrophosphatase/exopolyphosphatase